jgi:tryptophan-rich sensory protein
VKRSGRDKPIWVIIHICMEIIQEISLYRQLSSSQTSKNAVFLFTLHIFSSTKFEKKRGQKRFCLGGGVGGEKLTQIMCTHVTTCKK